MYSSIVISALVILTTAGVNGQINPELVNALQEMACSDLSDGYKAADGGSEVESMYLNAMNYLGCPGDEFRGTMDAVFDLSNLESYGCWCRMQADTHGKGRGAPVDAYDELCKIYHDGVTCLAMDYNSGCNPWDITYQFIVNNVDKTVDCVTLNGGDDCKENLCRVESRLVMDTLDLITGFSAPPLDHDQYNPTSPNYSGVWSHDQCVSPSTGGPGATVTLDCCGDYHLRWPFKSSVVKNGNNGIRSCCDFNNGDFGTTIYDPTKRTCCDGVVQPLGFLC